MDPNAVVLIALALALFVAELKVPTHGLLAGLGMLALAIGATIIVAEGGVGFGGGPWIVAAGVAGTCVLFGFWASKAAAARGRPVYPGGANLAGRPGVSRTAVDPLGEVFVDGALWSADARTATIPAGSPIVVVGRRGLVLEVEPAALASPGRGET